MTAVQGALERAVVTRLRVSHVATRIHDRMQEVGNPDRFEVLLQSPGPVRGLPLTLPYVDRSQTPVDLDVWSMIAETQLTGALNAAAAKVLRRQAVPLRLRAELHADVPDLGGEPPYLEIHVHPFGAVGIATVELLWKDPLPLGEAWSTLATIAKRPVDVELAGRTGHTTLSAAAGMAADDALDVLAAGNGAQAPVPDYRVATVIDGAIEPVPTAMPGDASPLHLALHHLCGGADPPAPPANAFIPIWSGAGFVYWPQQLAYMVDKGAAVWATGQQQAPRLTLGQQHRRLTLLLAHITASIGLIDASSTSSAASFKAWAKTAANRLARLYGPALSEQGIEAQRYLDQTGFRALVENILGKPLVANNRFPLPDYK